MRRDFLIVGAIILGLSFSENAIARTQTAGEPELPRVILSTSYPTNGGATLAVSVGGSLQAALNSAQLGDTIVLQAGSVYSGNFTLPAKTGSGWIVIRTSNLAGLPLAGTRVTPNHAPVMPRILSPNAAPALSTSAGANHYRLVGLEIGIAAGVSVNHGIVSLGDGSQSSISLVPRDLVIDRCYIHGNSTGNVSRGIALNSASTAIIDSHISAIHGVGFDTQAICGWNGPGPFKIVNNYLEAAGENVMFGGADPRVRDLIPSDIEFRRNHCSKPLSWNPSHSSYAGIHWSVKNVFELKNAQRVLVDGNVFERCWVDGQTGFLVVLTPRNQEGTAPWSAVRDVTFTNNIGRHAAAGLQLLGSDDIHPSQQQQRIKIKNNLFDDIGGSAWGGNGRLFQIIGGPSDVHIDHNTAFHTSNIITADGSASLRFVFTNNIMRNNDYGVMGSGRSPGSDTLNYYFPGYSFLKNVIIGGAASIYPTGNFFPAGISGVGFVDAAIGNYQLASTSSYRSAGTDGLDVGANLTAIQEAIGGQQTPSDPLPNQPPQVGIVPSSISGVAPLNVTFSANAFDPDGSITSYEWDFGDGGTSTLQSVGHVYQSSGSFTARVTVTDNLGATETASAVITVNSPSLPAGSEIVLYASKASTRVGDWSVVTDPTAAGGRAIWNRDVGRPKINSPVALPGHYFEMTFHAVAGRPYRLWVRGRAENNSPYNDSVFVQFSSTVGSNGAPVFRIGTTDATTINLEDCLGCGVQGWGWQDNGWGVGVMGPLVNFSNTGLQRLRVQVREDGLLLDQIVLSPELYLETSPGALRNDSTVLTESSGLPAPTITGVTPGFGPVAGGTRLVVGGQGFAPGALVTVGGVPAASVQVENATSITAFTPPHSSGVVDVVVTNSDGKVARLASCFTYVAPNEAPRVNITTSTTSGPAPLAVDLAADASDLDGSITGYLWEFGDGQTSTLPAVTHVYQSPGSFVTRVTVTDNLGAATTASVTISVAAQSGLVVRVLNPNGGEALKFGSTFNITWSVSGGSPSRQDVLLSRDGGVTWSVLASGLPGTVKNFLWRVPKSATTSARIRVRVLDTNGAIVEDTSDANFTIRKILQ
jgi:PKD repeat protein